MLIDRFPAMNLKGRRSFGDPMQALGIPKFGWLKTYSKLTAIPAISNIKNYMLKWLAVPLDKVPRLERLIIMRSGRPERQ